MTNTLQVGTSRTGAYVRSVRWGLVALVAMAAMVWYGAYGDPHPKSDQEAAVPALIGVMAVVIVALFLGLVAAGLRGAAANPGRWSAIGLSLSTLGLLAVPFASWAGAPLAFGIAGALLGAATSVKVGAAARAIGVVAVILSVVMLVVGNTVLSH
jgi:peptidoglycan/LPS O-acetylase OafA/YrhL